MEKEKQKNELQVSNNQLSASERFANKVIQEFTSNVSGNLPLSDYQRTLVQGYFIGIDRALKKSEEERQRRNANNKDPKYNNLLPFTWNNVDLNTLAIDVVYSARLGLDMMQPNHVSPIAFKNNKLNKYTINLIVGYNGKKYMAENYALIPPKSVTIDLVYSTDKFRPIKKGHNQPFETYEFEITNPFDRGDIVGGFGYIEYEDKTRNELVIMTKKAIDKRKPRFASANFWGGETVEYKNGQKVTEEKEGWYEEMARKTLIREVYSQKHIPLDPKKVDYAYQYMKQQEMNLQYAEANLQQEKNVTANTVSLEDSIENNATIAHQLEQVHESAKEEAERRDFVGEPDRQWTEMDEQMADELAHDLTEMRAKEALEQPQYGPAGPTF